MKCFAIIDFYKTEILGMHKRKGYGRIYEYL
jgi:hypothetical protein